MCGIIGIFNNENSASLATLGMFAEQHRGQESCGLAVSDEKVIRLRKKMGLVKQVFKQKDLEKLKGNIAIGHVRYPTCGSATEYNSQPHVVETLAGPSFALASNGDIVNYYDIRRKLEDKGVYFASNNDGELLLKYIIYYVEKQDYSITEAIQKMMRNIRGAYSTVLITRKQLFCFRDPHAIRPMSYGELEDGTFVVASESCALDILSPKYIKEVNPAEIIVVNKKETKIIQNDPNNFRKIKSDKHCIFEHVYFSRPDSINFSEPVFSVREKIGAQLAKNDNIEVDAVIPVPDSSNFIALGYSKEKKISFDMGLIRNHYVGRTFIKPEQTIRDESVKQKFNTLPGFFKDKKIVLIDDSIVRGTTLKKIVKLLRNVGAKEIHLRIGSPAVINSCYYGIDTPDKDKLIANKMSNEDIAKELNADSLKYISVEGLKKCVYDGNNFCTACFTGDYPLEF